MDRATNGMDERGRRFLATASHDLQAPLRHIAMYAEILLDDLGETLDADHIHSLKAIVEKARDAQQLTKALMAMAAGAPQAVICDVDAEALVALAWRDAGEDETMFAATIDIGPLPRLRADAALLASALAAVLRNALTHSGGKAVHVSVSARIEGGLGTILIADDGPGIEAAHSEKIFEPFWRLATPGAAAGPGLGLATARETVEAMGGTLTLDRSHRPGSLFAITLPASRI